MFYWENLSSKEKRFELVFWGGVVVMLLVITGLAVYMYMQGHA